MDYYTGSGFFHCSDKAWEASLFWDTSAVLTYWVYIVVWWIAVVEHCFFKDW
jgi:hypothetical protein